MSAQQYYAFGALMPGDATSAITRRQYSLGGYDHRYGFNGKEGDDEVSGDDNQVDFGARPYDPRVGRWLGVDPDIKVYESSYASMANSPIYIIDPDGQDSIVVHLARVTNNKDANRANVALFKVTFYHIKNGIWKIEEPNVSKLTNSNEFNLIMPESAFVHKNKMNKQDFYELSYQSMASHPDFKKTVLVQPGSGNSRGQFIHEGKNVGESAGCLLPCQEKNLEYTHHPGGELSTPWSEVIFYRKENKRASGDLSRELLGELQRIYQSARDENSIPDKPFGFLLTTKDISPFIKTETQKIQPITPNPSRQDTTSKQ